MWKWSTKSSKTTSRLACSARGRYQCFVQTSELDFHYPESLVAIEPQEPCRILYGNSTDGPREISRTQLFDLFKSGDLLVRNNTLVEKRRVFSENGLEILFLENIADKKWSVLYPARGMKLGDVMTLPLGVTATLIEKGLPQTLELSHKIDTAYFQEVGELALPPYIQKARELRHNLAADSDWYQTAWAKNHGSVASPTASLHFSEADFAELNSRGVQLAEVTLHVGIGTFLPVRSEDLNEHQMHSEKLEVPSETRDAVGKCKEQGGRVWALGSTVVRALESDQDSGATELFIQPGYDWKVVNGLLTNFHQPKTTLLAMVSAFSGLDEMKRAYALAIENQFRLFSYGDLSVWTR